MTPEQEKDFEDAATFIESLHAGRRKEGRAILSRLRALLEVSAGEALREAHNKLIRAADPARMDSHHRQEFELEAHAALDAAVAAAVREEREKRGHAQNCECHPEQMNQAECLMPLYQGGHDHPYRDPRCEVKE